MLVYLLDVLAEILEILITCDILVPKYETEVCIVDHDNRKYIALSSPPMRGFLYEEGFHRHELYTSLSESA